MSEAFKHYKIAPKPGQIRRKAWRSIVPVPDPENDEMWKKRCTDYWEREQRTYGVKFDAIAIYYDPELMAIKTLARIERVIEGLRL